MPLYNVPVGILLDRITVTLYVNNDRRTRQALRPAEKNI